MTRFIQPSEIQVGDKIKTNFKVEDVEKSVLGVVARRNGWGVVAKSSNYLYYETWRDATVELLHREVVEPTTFGSMVVLDDGSHLVRADNDGESWRGTGGWSHWSSWREIKNRVVSVHAPAVVANGGEDK